jgi:hypothetical protein
MNLTLKIVRDCFIFVYTKFSPFGVPGAGAACGDEEAHWWWDRGPREWRLKECGWPSPVAPPPAAGRWKRRPWAAPRCLHLQFFMVACTRDGDPGPPIFGRLQEQLHTEADLTQSKDNTSTSFRLGLSLGWVCYFGIKR